MNKLFQCLKISDHIKKPLLISSAMIIYTAIVALWIFDLGHFHIFQNKTEIKDNTASLAAPSIAETIATSTVDIRGYTIELSRSFNWDKPDIGWSMVRILNKSGQALFTTEKTHDFGGFYTNEVDDWIQSANDIKSKAIKDITGDGIPDLILEAYSGGAHCCSHNYIIELSNPISILLDLDTGDNGIEFKDLNHDGMMEIVTYEDTFSYWNTDFADSPMPLVILSLQHGEYKADPVFMRKPAPTDAEIRKMADTITSWNSAVDYNMPWKYALDLIYSGNLKSARKYVDFAWRADNSGDFKTKDDFWAELKNQIQQSMYYSDLSTYFGL